MARVEEGWVVSAGNRADDAYSMNGNAVMYDVGKILIASGSPAYDNGIATSSAYLINLNGAVPNSPVSATKIAPMTYAAAVIEVKLAGAIVRVVSGSDDGTQLAAVLRAVRASAPGK